MSISGALSNALSGLTASSRAAQTVSSNLANVMTEGYGRRSLALTARGQGSHGGVLINGVRRNVDMNVVSDWRIAGATTANATENHNFLNRLEQLVGTPDDAFSLSARLADFESALVGAASRPDLNERLQDVLHQANGLVAGFNNISNGIQSMRQEADREIAASVDLLNTTLSQVRELNTQIVAAGVQGHDVAALQDHRQVLINEISGIIPVREVPRDHGAVALFTTGGAIVLDGSAAEFEFTASNVIAPHMRLDNALLSGITMNGHPISADADTGLLRGGKLAALFEVRDGSAVEAQTRLDAVARDLVERFQDLALDLTRAPGAAGLFSDSGAFFNATDEIGLSGRLEVNALADPAQGGALWRLRDGLGATAPGAAGQAALLNDMQGVLTALKVPASGGFGANARSMAALNADFLSSIGTDKQQRENALSFASTQLTTLQTQLLSDGVDSDYELSQLMLIEQAYAANARLVATADEMIQTLLRI